jgi:pimeloyl-ACP methyl ester carboxylesterase
MTLQAGTRTVAVSTRPAAGSNALIYFGGNAEDVSLDMPSFSVAFPNYAIYLLHYPGYGGSSGSPSEQAIFADALALFDRVHAEHQNIVVVGRSLGSGVAIYVASLRPVARLVLVTPYDSLQDVAAQNYPYLPVRWLLRDKFESWRYAPQVVAPTRIIVAEQDEVIPRASTDRLRTRFKNGIVSYVVVAGAGHNTISDSADYLSLLKNE